MLFNLSLVLSDFFPKIFYDNIYIFLFALFLVIFEFFIVSSETFVAPYFFNEGVLLLLLFSFLVGVLFEVNDTTVHIVKVGKFYLKLWKKFTLSLSRASLWNLSSKYTPFWVVILKISRQLLSQIMITNLLGLFIWDTFSIFWKESSINNSCFKRLMI